MLHAWIWTYNEINAGPKGSWKNRQRTTPKEPEMEEELHKLFVTVRHMYAATAVSVTRGSYKGQFPRGSSQGLRPKQPDSLCI
jgi:hypothetical protein